MLQATVSFKGDVFKELERAKKDTRDEIVSVVNAVTETVIDRSPVWSGAYVRSFAWSANGARKRRSYRSNREVRVDPAAAKGEAATQLYTDLSVIDQIDLEDLKSITLTNGAPHASLVEFGTSKAPDGYGIFAVARDMLSNVGMVRAGRVKEARSV